MTNQDNNHPKLPIITAKKSKTMNLNPGHYSICSCGLSKDQPYCDGSHKGTSFSPKEITIRSPKTVSICLCKHAASFPYCDGSHKQLR